ncbi:methyltransferase [Candidatus Micrarchaeota archaeon]|nr:methyltransferase [Candidatus Micrarchaeota archaeon]
MVNPKESRNKEPKLKFYKKSSDGSLTYLTDLEENFLFVQRLDGTISRLDLFDQHYYKLRLYNGIPILEVDGLRMQLVRDFKTPLDYAKEVVDGLKIQNKGKFHVFDSCMGLGYTAIEVSTRPSVASVTSSEISQAVITLAKYNPYSEQLFTNKKIEIINQDSFKFIKSIADNSFDFVIHDPPRFSHADELYSNEFYQNLHRVCKKGAKIFHYVGSVGTKGGRSIEEEVIGRLLKAGFKNTIYVKKLQGLYFEK